MKLKIFLTVLCIAASAALFALTQLYVFKPQTRAGLEAASQIPGILAAGVLLNSILNEKLRRKLSELREGALSAGKIRRESAALLVAATLFFCAGESELFPRLTLWFTAAVLAIHCLLWDLRAWAEETLAKHKKSVAGT